MLEDFFPAGCEVVRDTRGYNITNENFYGFKYGESWDYWTHQLEIHDDRMAFFGSYLYKGQATIQYILRAELPGTYHAMPAVGKLMYYPEVNGNSADDTLIIKIKEGDSGE